MHFKSIGMKFVAGLAIIMVLAGCTPVMPNSAPYAQPTAAPTVDQQPTLDAVRTQAVLTAMTNLTQSAVQSSTEQPAAVQAATSTLAATAVPAATATPAPTKAPAPVLALATATAASIPYSTPTLTTYSCGVISVWPSLTDRVKAGTSFTGSWRIENTGTEYWQATEADVRYIMGEKFQTKVDPYDLGMTVGPTGMYTVNIDMKAPKLAGPYYAQWAIKYGQITICTLNLTVYVVN